MSFELEYAVLIQKYLKELRDLDLSIDEIMQRSRWKRVYFWWKALEHYEGKEMPKLTLDEIKDIYGDE